MTQAVQDRKRQTPWPFRLVCNAFSLALISCFWPAIGKTQPIAEEMTWPVSKADNATNLDALVSQVSVDFPTISAQLGQQSGAYQAGDFPQMVFCSTHQAYEAKTGISFWQQPAPVAYDPLGLGGQ